jgi:hypothetical protein
MRKRTEARLVDRMVCAYVDWHEACRRRDGSIRSKFG